MTVSSSTMPDRGEVRGRSRTAGLLPITMSGKKGIEEEDRNDICLTYKYRSLEYINKVEKEARFEDQAVPELYGIKFRDDDEAPYVASSCIPTSKPVKLISVFFLLGMMAQCVVGATTPLYPSPSTVQLPQACLDILRSPEYECPFQDINWTDLNRLCCRNEHEHEHALLLHVQKQPINGSDFCFATCLPDRVVPAGKIGKLVDKGGGWLEVDVETDCPEHLYRPHSINSSQLRYGYCLRRKTSPDVGQEACVTGPAADDLLYCQVGFTSHIDHGVNDVTPPFDLSCQPLRCDSDRGLAPFRDMTGPCTDPSTRVEYGCKPPSATTTTTTTTTTTNDTASATTSGATLRRVGFSKTVLAIVSVLVGLIVCALFLLGIWYFAKKSGVLDKMLNEGTLCVRLAPSSLAGNDPESGESMMG